VSDVSFQNSKFLIIFLTITATTACGQTEVSWHHVSSSLNRRRRASAMSLQCVDTVNICSECWRWCFVDIIWWSCNFQRNVAIALQSSASHKMLSLVCRLWRVCIVTKQLEIGSRSIHRKAAKGLNCLHGKFEKEIRRGSWGGVVFDFAMLYYTL